MSIINSIILHFSSKPEQVLKYPRVKRAAFRRWNEGMFKRYNNERVYNHPNIIIRFIERRRVDFVLEELGQTKFSDNILAAGCGEGYIERRISLGKLVLVDLSKEAIARAKKNLRGRKNVEFIVADLESLPFSSSTFDKIECSEVIEHVYSPEKLMVELRRVLKGKGILIITFPNEPLINFIKRIFIRLGVFTLFFPNVPRDMTKEWHLHSFDLDRFKKLIGSNWKILSVREVPFGFLPIRYVVKCQKS